MIKPVLDMTDQEFEEYFHSLQTKYSQDELMDVNLKRLIKDKNYSVGFITKIKQKLNNYNDLLFLEREFFNLTKVKGIKDIEKGELGQMSFRDRVYLRFIKNRIERVRKNRVKYLPKTQADEVWDNEI